MQGSKGGTVHRISFRKPFQLVMVLAVCLGTMAVGAVGAPAASAGVAVPKGAAKPVPGSGIGTPAALNDERCHVKSPEGETLYEGYGRWNTTELSGSPGTQRGAICVKPWKDGDDNGGATSQGVTKDAIKIVVVIPNDAQRAQSNAISNLPTRRTDLTKAAGTYQDAVHDFMMAYSQFFQTWGRDLDFRFVTSSGQDEAAQRADAVTIKAMKPFAVVNMVFTGLDTLDTELAKAKILVNGDSANTQKSLAQEPYRWGVADAQAAAVNSAEVVGKQFVGKKAEFAGDDLKGQPRKFGLISLDGQYDIDQFKAMFKDYGGRITSEATYVGPGSPLGDSTQAQQDAPAIVTKMKAAGVTTVILLADSAMVRALMNVATNQEWFPEWWSTGAMFHDATSFLRSYPQEQAVHMFGLSSLSPAIEGQSTAATAGTLAAVDGTWQWYWGTGVGTSTNTRSFWWLMGGIHAAGPKLTPKNFAQGWFSVPASGGAASNYKFGTMYGYGKNAGTPYNVYGLAGLDYAPYFYEPNEVGPSNVVPTDGKGVSYYLDGSKRYKAGSWPKKALNWFDKDGAVLIFPTRPDPTPVYTECTQCPAKGAPGQPGAPSLDGFVIPATKGDLAIKTDDAAG
jgi:hypothetical protein